MTADELRAVALQAIDTAKRAGRELHRNDGMMQVTYPRIDGDVYSVRLHCQCLVGPGPDDHCWRLWHGPVLDIVLERAAREVQGWAEKLNDVW